MQAQIIPSIQYICYLLQLFPWSRPSAAGWKRCHFAVHGSTSASSVGTSSTGCRPTAGTRAWFTCMYMFGAMTYWEQLIFSFNQILSLYTRGNFQNGDSLKQIFSRTQYKCTGDRVMYSIPLILYICTMSYLLAELHPVALVKLQYLVVNGDTQYKTCTIHSDVTTTPLYKLHSIYQSMIGQLPSGEGHSGCEGVRCRGGGCSGVRCFLRDERGGVGRQDWGRDPVIIPWGNILYRTFIPAAIHYSTWNTHICAYVHIHTSLSYSYEKADWLCKHNLNQSGTL